MNTSYRNYAIAVVIALAVAIWLGAGMVFGSKPEAATKSSESQKPGEPFLVEVVPVALQTVQRFVTSHGETAPNRVVTLRAQTAGEVASLGVRIGERVDAGDLLVQLAMKDRQARLRQVEAQLQQRQLSYEAISALQSKGYQARLQEKEAKAALEAARAELARIELDIAHTRIDAPFAGVVEQTMAEQGDFVGVGDPVAVLVDINPLKVVVYLSEQDVQRVQTGQSAKVHLLAADETRDAVVKAIAPRADDQTRTYRVELEVDNTSGTPAGASAEAVLPVGAVQAVQLSPSMFGLDADGRLGVKAVSEAGEVMFHPVTIVKSGEDGVWVTGVPDGARLITRGAAFVSEGDTVKTQVADKPKTDAGRDPAVLEQDG